MKKIKLSEFKKRIIDSYYPDRDNTNEYNRKVYLTRVKDNYNKIGTIIISIEGSPPKGVAILVSREIYGERLMGRWHFLRHNAKGGFSFRANNYDYEVILDEEFY